MNGKEALDWINNRPEWPDIILLDFNMPVMSGGEFLKEARKLMDSRVVPIIMVSAQAEKRNIVANLKLGANDFVKKPYNGEELLARINSLLRTKTDWLKELLQGWPLFRAGDQVNPSPFG